MITAQLVKELRDATNLGILDCKKALEATNGNIDAAIDWLREKGIAKAAKKESRIAAEGLANIYVSGNKAVILEVNSETDFVAQNEDFKKMVDEIGNAVLNSDATTVEEANALEVNGTTVGDYVVAMAAMKPEYTFEADVPEERVAKEKEVLKEEAMKEGKPAEIAEKMVAGRLKKFFKEICLVDQEFIKDGDVDVKTYLANNKCELEKMVRYEVGEGIEKKVENFAEEVMSQVKGTN